MVLNLSILQTSEIRLFDRGEMNTYRDEMNFVCQLNSHLARCLDQLQAEDPGQERTMADCATVLDTRLDRLQLQLQAHTETPPPQLSSPLLDQPTYQEAMINTCRLLLAATATIRATRQLLGTTSDPSDKREGKVMQLQTLTEQVVTAWQSGGLPRNVLLETVFRDITAS